MLKQIMTPLFFLFLFTCVTPTSALAVPRSIEGPQREVFVRLLASNVFPPGGEITIVGVGASATRSNIKVHYLSYCAEKKVVRGDVEANYEGRIKAGFVVKAGTARIRIRWENENITIDVGKAKGLINVAAAKRWLRKANTQYVNSRTWPAPVMGQKSVDEVESMSKKELKAHLEQLSQDDLAGILEAIDKATLTVALNTVDLDILGVGLATVDQATLRVGLIVLNKSRLEIGLEELKKKRLKVALECIDRRTLSAAMQVIDDDTYAVGLSVVDAPTRLLMEEFRKS